MRKKILVTGGAGFIGSNLCGRLLLDGNEVICLDNFITGFKTNLSQYLANPRFEMIRHDIINPIWLEVDEIYNLACPASPGHYQRDPVKTLKTSLLGAINMLELAKERKTKILQASTSEIYGEPAVHPQTEEYWGNVNPIGIRSCYDEGKRAVESLFCEYHRQYGINIKIVRIFNTYGPKMAPDDGRVVSNFVVQALKNKAITVYGDGRQTRSFCYISDLVEGLIKMMWADSITGPINLGNPAELTILELADKILSLTGSKSRLLFKPLTQDDPKRRKPDITKAKSCLGWESIVAIDDGLKKTIDYFQRILL
jgi:UDP-glucuronate decarboxylase